MSEPASSRSAKPTPRTILRAYDFNVPPGQVAGDVEEAVEAAGKIGYPVAMKIVSPDIIHKSDMGGVKLNLDSPEDVRDAFDLMMLRIGSACPKPDSKGSTSRRCASAAGR